ncbi:glycoside hydrolase family 3 protein [Lutibacter sp.]|uniref:beta-glucosidase n=1 Tax=Lutibacter sp. TaxID=1925666 RepID=UPI001A1FDDFD|nr:glycoside hydrolase family 3 C-terminal domain-containing protein [Lutibacter sp.]MBI9040975.1 glycoside hydrolase family 3 C-terminal domain-containing protein [Lutibacter sp.]
MKFITSLLLSSLLILSCSEKNKEMITIKEEPVKPFSPPVSYEVASKKADEILTQLTIEEKINLIGGHNWFFIEGIDKFGIPKLYLSDATQGVHIRKELSGQLEKSTAFPCPILLASTWNPEIAQSYATSIGEECRAGDIAVLLGPGMNIYRVSKNGRNFEYFGEDPYLTSRFIENYVVGIQNTGTIATLKHFLANNHEFHRRKTNVIIDERTIHEIYTPAFKAGIDAGAMTVMTSYNKVNGEWAGQSNYVITDLLKGELGFKGMVMTDWWSVWDPQKTITSGMDLEMPGETNEGFAVNGDVYVRSNAKKLLDEGKVSEQDINRMAKNVITLSLAMGLDKRPVKDENYLAKFPEHEKVALKTAKEGIVLLKNEHILPISKDKKILLTGEFVETLARGGGSAEVEGYNIVSMLNAFKTEFGDKLTFSKTPSNEEIKNADVVLISIGTLDNEGWDKSFELPKETNEMILSIASKNPNTVVIVNSGSGIEMTPWNSKVAGVINSWYVGQNGNIALAEIVSGKTNPSGKLPISIEKQFSDSPGANYLPENAVMYSGWLEDGNMEYPQIDVTYSEGVLVGYRWYETKKIEPLYAFGFGLSYSTFEFSNLKLSTNKLTENNTLKVTFQITNTSNIEGAEVAQLYVQDLESSVIRPLKELKGFKKVQLKRDESVLIEMELTPKDLSFYDVNSKSWKAETGVFNILVGNASNNTPLKTSFTYSEK